MKVFYEILPVFADVWMEIVRKRSKLSVQLKEIAKANQSFGKVPLREAKIMKVAHYILYS